MEEWEYLFHSNASYQSPVIQTVWILQLYKSYIFSQSIFNCKNNRFCSCCKNNHVSNYHYNFSIIDISLEEGNIWHCGPHHWIQIMNGFLVGNDNVMMSSICKNWVCCEIHVKGWHWMTFLILLYLSHVMQVCCMPTTCDCWACFLFLFLWQFWIY